MPDVDADQAEQGYAMTQILPRFGEGSVVLGFDRHDRFQHSFRYETHQSPIALTIQTLWDRKTQSGTICESERLVCYAHPEIEEALRAWARLVAEVSNHPPRISGPGITGWSS